MVQPWAKTKRFHILQTGILLITIAFSTSGQAESSKPLMVFLHGAHLTADSWSLVSDQLKAKGIESYSINLPGRNDKKNPKLVTLTSSARHLCSELKSVDQDVIFVVHSQAGAIINHSQSICPKQNIKGIIYLASVFPTDGERAFDRLSKLDEENYFKGISFDEKNSIMVISNRFEFLNTFTSLRRFEQPEGLEAYAVDEPARIADGFVKYNKEVLDSVPKYYIFTTKDLIISPESQLAIAKHMEPASTYEINSGHIPMLTHPNELSGILIGLLDK